MCDGLNALATSGGRRRPEIFVIAEAPQALQQTVRVWRCPTERCLPCPYLTHTKQRSSLALQCVGAGQFFSDLFVLDTDTMAWEADPPRSSDVELTWLCCDRSFAPLALLLASEAHPPSVSSLPLNIVSLRGLCH